MKNGILILFTIFFFACNSNSVKESELQKQNDILQAKLDSIVKTSSKTFAFCQFTVSLPEFQQADKTYTDWKTQSFVSPISEFTSFDQETESRFLDKVEATFRASKMAEWPIKVKDRKCSTFKSYSDASKTRNSLTNN